MIPRKSLSPEQALQKLKHFCGYQERCHSEVRDKLYRLGMRKEQVESLLSQLIEEDYLNEQRFAIQFAGGRFRLKGWGKARIQAALQEKRVSPYCIRLALDSLPEDDYRRSVEKIARKKWEQLEAGGNPLLRRQKTLQYLLSRGYEYSLCSGIVKSLEES